MTKAHLDFETRSAIDLVKVGLWPYVLSPTTRILLFRYRIGKGPVKAWRPGEVFPQELADWVAAGGEIVAHNAAFEREVWNYVLRRDFPHLAPIRIEQQNCTMARANAIALPGGLDEIAKVLRTAFQKDEEGSALMKRMSKPQKIVHSSDLAREWFVERDPMVLSFVSPDMTHERYTYDADPNQYTDLFWLYDEEKMDRLGIYCDIDVETECDVDDALPELIPQERPVWMLDQIINQRGVRFDERLCRRAALVAEIAKRENDKEMKRITNGYVRKCTEVKRLVEWLNFRGVECTSVGKGEFEELIEITARNGDWLADEAIRLRKTASKSSVAKYEKMLACRCPDQRLRSLLAYSVANTARWGGRLVQPQNYPRVDADREAPTVRVVLHFLDLIGNSETCYAMLKSELGDVLFWLSKALRSMFICADDALFYGGDFSNIEGRLNSYLNNDVAKVEKFRAYDTIVGVGADGKPKRGGPDLYKVAFSDSFGIPIDDVDKAQRQIGKVEELSMGYQGGVGAFIKMGANYNVRPGDIAKQVHNIVPSSRWEYMASMYPDAMDKHGLDEFVWTGIKLVVSGWRQANPGVNAGWKELQEAGVAAVSNPGYRYTCMGGRVTYVKLGNNLYCQLPSGRCLTYHEARIKMVRRVELVLDEEGVEVEVEVGRARAAVEFYGLNSKTRKMGWRVLYGGLQDENIVQATARDTMVFAMFNVEAAGYPLVLTVHDELLAERTRGQGCEQEFQEIMQRLPPFLPNFPLAASTWTGTRYDK